MLLIDNLIGTVFDSICDFLRVFLMVIMSVKRICEVIMRDEKSILPVSHMIHGVYEIDDVVLSMPVIVGADGIESDIPINLSGEEALKLKESADALKNIIETLEL